jgi:hypothetical protein
VILNGYLLSLISGVLRAAVVAGIVTTILAAVGSSLAAAQSRTAAITIDNLPFVTGSDAPMGPQDAPAAIAANRKLLNTLARHQVPVTGFVNEKRLSSSGCRMGPGF